MNKTPLDRIGFAGTPEFAATILAALCRSDYKPSIVLTQPDRRAGRGRKLAPGAVKAVAHAHALPVWQPESLKLAETQTELASLNLDLLIVVAYGLILPSATLVAPRLGCINVHASILPRWRGAAPVQAAIAAGDTATGVTIMQMDVGLDTGPVLSERRCPITPTHTGATLTAQLAELGAQCLLETLPAIEREALDPIAQDDTFSTYAPRIQKAQAEIQFATSAAALERRIRAFDPWPVAYTTLGEDRLRIWRAEAHVGADSGAMPGTVIAATDDGIDIATEHGVLRITELQRAGARRVSAAQFLQGRTLTPGTVLGGNNG